MMNLEQAETINKEVRKFFATGKKSFNKIFSDDWDADGEWDHQNADKRMENRNVNAKSALGLVMSLRLKELKNCKNSVEYGESIYYTGSNPAGNCIEMACVAAYIAVRDHDSSNLSLVSIDSPGDHVFLAVGEAAFLSKMKMRNMGDIDNIRTIIIDPWANIVCRPDDYPVKFFDKMQKWTGIGKNIVGSEVMIARRFYDLNSISSMSVINALKSKPDSL